MPRKCPSSAKCRPSNEAFAPRLANQPRIDPGSIGPVELEAINAISAWKERTGHAFPSVTELLRILQGIGWRPPAGR